MTTARKYLDILREREPQLWKITVLISFCGDSFACSWSKTFSCEKNGYVPRPEFNIGPTVEFEWHNIQGNSGAEFLKNLQQEQKTQVNRFLFAFTKSFKENAPDADADAILFQFCREYLDEMKFPGDSLHRHHLPFQLTKLLDNYLSRECEKDQMPQMRWAYQIFGNSYNPHDPKLEHEFYHILKRAYMHEKCDSQTVQLYFREQLDSLWRGSIKIEAINRAGPGPPLICDVVIIYYTVKNAGKQSR